MVKIRLLVIMCLMFFSVPGMTQSGFSFSERTSEKKIILQYDGNLVTAYCYFDSTKKPVLFPLKTLSGTTVTRGFPIAPRRGERTDHPHHAGLWFTYEKVNGLDFWNNSHPIPDERKPQYGSIIHQKVLSMSADKDEATLTVLSHWVDHRNKVLLHETTAFTFQKVGTDLFIDRKCTLEAISPEVIFADVKDGLIGIRVARSLEMPSPQMDRFIDSQGKETEEPALNNEGVTGMYVNREGIKGDEVWSSSSSWAQLYGYVQDKPVSIVIIDHNGNPGYPTYWHARGYGLFAANPLGRKVFSGGKEELNFTLKKGQKQVFQYRVIIHDGDPLSTEEVNQVMDDFHGQK
jgi:hypothetical protein